MRKILYFITFSLFFLHYLGYSQTLQPPLLSEEQRAALNSIKEENNIYTLERQQRIVNYLSTANSIQNNDDSQLFDVLTGEDGEYIPIYVSTINSQVAERLDIDNLHNGIVGGYNLTGDGITVHVWDGGHLNSHIEFENRIKGTSDIDLRNGKSSLSYHAIHVTGTIAAMGHNSEAKGMAPSVKIRSHDFSGAINEMQEYLKDSDKALYLSNNSYGASLGLLGTIIYGGDYLKSTRILDQICYNSPYYLPVFAAGNDGRLATRSGAQIKYKHVSMWATSKNALVVGSVKVDPSNPDSKSFTPSAFSSRGPTSDMRIKPDIVSYGEGLFSSMGFNSFSDINNQYGALSGTSMSTPVVTGTAALLHELHLTKYGSWMKAATLKGILMHTAKSFNGISGGPDKHHGWGLVQPEEAAKLIESKDELNSITEGNLTSQSPTYTTQIVAGSVNPIKVSLIWTDAADKSTEDVLFVTNDSEPNLINDLDLRITNTTTGETYFPFRLQADFKNSIFLDFTTLRVDTGDNIRDNFEQIIIPSAQGTYDITVSSKVQNLEQEFTLIISGIDDYCKLEGGDTSSEYIDKVEIGDDFENSSGDNTGYAEFLDNPIQLNVGDDVNFSIHPGFPSGSNSEFFKIEIDKNQDLEFDENEVIYYEGHTVDLLSDNFTIPQDTKLGHTRIRISMSPNNEIENLQCGNYQNGETEVYAIEIIDTEAPSKPTILNSKVSDNNVLLEWSSTDNSGVTAAYINVDGTERFVHGNSIGTFKPFNFQLGVARTATLRTVDASGNISEVSDEFTLLYEDTEAPSPATNLVASLSHSGRVNLNFIHATDNINVKKYNVFIGDVVQDVINPKTGDSVIDLPFLATLPIQATAFSDISNYPYESTIYIMVRAFDSAGNFSDSELLEYKIEDLLPPKMPSVSITDLPNYENQNSLSISVSTDDYSPLNQYNVYINDNLTRTIYEVSESMEIDLTGLSLQNDQEYLIEVEAIDTNNLTSPKGKTKFTSDFELPTAPSIVSVHSDSYYFPEVNIVFSAATDNNEVKSYEIYKNDVKIGVKSSQEGRALYDLTIVEANGTTSGVYFVAAVDRSGNKMFSDPYTFIYIDQEPPTTPGSFSAQYDNTTNNLQITWQESVDNVAVTKYYLMIYSTSGNLNTTIEISDPSLTSFTHQINLNPGDYNLWLYATDANSNQSNPAEYLLTIVDQMPTGYCSSTAASQNWEYINSVSVGSLQNLNSGASQYSNFANTITPVELSEGASINYSLTPGFPRGYSFKQFWRIWIDYNRDGNFSSNELVVNKSSSSKITGDFTIPNSLSSYGLTMMRVSMRFYRSPNVCGSIYYGEVEDYAVRLSPSQQSGVVSRGLAKTEAVSPNFKEVIEPLYNKRSIDFFPNPVTKSITIFNDFVINKGTILILDINGKIVFSQSFEKNKREIIIENLETILSDSVYFLKLIDQTTKESKIEKLIFHKE